MHPLAHAPLGLALAHRGELAPALKHLSLVEPDAVVLATRIRTRLSAFFYASQEFTLWLPGLVVLAVLGYVILGAIVRVGPDALAWLAELPALCAYAAAWLAFGCAIKAVYMHDIDRATECVHSYELVLPLPDAMARRKDVPFKWVLLNWNPHGHIPPGVYDTPHFDVHFYMEPIAKVFALRAGPCGPELMNCDQYAIAKRPVPSNYVHPDFKDVDGVVPAMGNHLVDLTGPEFQKQPFTRSWIFGAYEGRIIFYEEMVAHRHLVQQPRSCAPIKQPEGWATAGFYPTVSCLRHDAATGETTVSIERFVFRPASAPEL